MHLAVLVYKLFAVGNIFVNGQKQVNADSTERCLKKEATQDYVFSFPAAAIEDSGKWAGYFLNKDLQKQNYLSISSPSPCDVTINITSFRYNASSQSYHSIQECRVLRGADKTLDIGISEWLITGSTSDSEYASLTFPESTRVTSDEEIDVYAHSVYVFEVHSSSATQVRPMYVSTAVSPRSQLGLHYNVTLPSKTLSDGSTTGTFFLVTSVEDNIDLTIHSPRCLSVNLITFDSEGLAKKPRGNYIESDKSVEISLDSHHTVRGTCKTSMIGTVIKSSKPVAVIAGYLNPNHKGECCWSHPWTHLPPVRPKAREADIPAVGTTSAPKASQNEDEQHSATSNPKDYDNERTVTPSVKLMNLNTFVEQSPFAVKKIVLQEKESCVFELDAFWHWGTTLTFHKPAMTPWNGTDFEVSVIIITKEVDKNNITCTLNGKRQGIQWRPVSTNARVASNSLVTGEVSIQSKGEYVLSSVSGTSLMAAYVIGNQSSERVVCFALRGSKRKEIITNCTKSKEALVPAQKIQKCKCLKVPALNMTEKLKAQKEADTTLAGFNREIKAILQVPVSTVSSAMRKKLSSPDKRASSATIGYVTITVFTLILMVPVSLDVIRCVTWLLEKRADWLKVREVAPREEVKELETGAAP